MTRVRAAALLAPMLAVSLAGVLWPLARLVHMSLLESRDNGVILDRLTIANYVAFAAAPASLELARQSVWLGVTVTLVTLVCAYPLALFLHRAPRRWQATLFAVTVSPLLVSSVVRTYGWMALLGPDGPVNELVVGLGLAQAPLRLVNDLAGVRIGLVQILMPYMTLSLLAGFGRLDPAYEEAAATLGAGPLRRLWRVVIPLSLPGVALGCGLCFVLTVSSFITPKLLGGGRVFLLATEIYDLAVQRLQWPMAATTAVVVLISLALATALSARVLRSAGERHGG